MCLIADKKYGALIYFLKIPKFLYDFPKGAQIDHFIISA